MKKWFQRLPWPRLSVGLFVLVAVAYVVLDLSLALRLLTVAGLVAAVLAVTNPFAGRPRPELTLEPVDGREGTEFAVGPHRPLDVEAVISDGRARAVNTVPRHPALLLTAGLRTPTADELERFEEKVDRYVEELRAWVADAEQWRQAERFTLRAFVVQRNASTVDAEDAGVHVTFPPGTEDAEDSTLTFRATPPVAPVFQSKPMWMMSGIGSGYADFGISRPVLDFGVPATPLVSVWQPSYRTASDGALEVSYPRQSLRHGEREHSGDAFEVRLPLGEHEVEWRVHAANMAHSRTGTWKVTCSDEAAGVPITTLAELETELGIEQDDDDDV